MAQRISVAPSVPDRVLGFVGILGGGVLLAAFLPVDLGEGITATLRLVAYLIGAIAIVVAVHRRQAVVAPRLSKVVAIPALVACIWSIVGVILAQDRPRPPVGDPEFRLTFFFAGLALWITAAAFGFVAARLAVVTRVGALVLTCGSLLAIVGMDRLELVRGPYADLFVPLGLTGIALNGLGWILLGIDIVLRDRIVVESGTALREQPRGL